MINKTNVTKENQRAKDYDSDLVNPKQQFLSRLFGSQKWFIICITASVALIMSSCAIPNANSAGTINGKNIDKQDYMNALKGHFTGFVLEKDRTPDESEKQAIGKKTWRDITIHVILKDYFRKYEIQVSEQEVIDTLLNNIPVTIQSAPAFQSDGVFDRAMYISSLLQDKPQKLDWLRKHYFQYYIPIEKLKIELQRKSVISKKDLSQLTKTVNSKASIDWIVFDPSVCEVKVSQSEVENYYKSRQSEYQIKAYASLGFVTMPVRSSDQDVLTAKAKIDSLYQEIRNGASLGLLAEQFSESTSRTNQGSLGFVKPQSLPANVQKAIENLGKNQCTLPIKLDSAWALYELVERTKSLVKLNELMIRIIPGKETKEVAKSSAVNLRDLSLQLGLKTAASEMDSPYNEVKDVTRDSLWLADPSLGMYIMDRVFTQKTGVVLEPVYSSVLQAWVLVQILELQPYRVKPLITVSDEIEAIIRSQKQVTYSLGQAKFWSEQHKSDQLAAALAENLPIIKTQDLMIDGKINDMPLWNVFVEVLSNHSLAKTTKAYMVDDLILLPVINQVTELSPPLYDEQQVRQYYFSHINPDWFDKWLDKEIINAKVNIKTIYP